MDPLDFFLQYSGLSVPATTQPCGTGLCPHCLRVQLLHRKAAFTACGACAAIRLGYPFKGKQKFTLAKGDWAIVQPGGTCFYTSLRLPVPTKPPLVAGAADRLIYELVRDPPGTDYLLIHFGRPTDTTNFRINAAHGQTSFIHISGDPSIGRQNVGVINVWLIRDLLRQYAGLSADEWTKVISAKSDLRNPDRAQAAALIWKDYDHRYPGIFARLPGRRSVEHRVLEVATHDSTRGEVSSTDGRRHGSQ